MLATPSRRGPRVVHSYPKFYACYLLKSIQTPDIKATYIGSTPDPLRRIRQHNGELSQGARKTARKRPWVMQMLVHGFPSRLLALQFEWAWQNPHRSRHFLDKEGMRLFGNCATTALKKNVIIVRTMVAKHPYDTWPLHVKLFTPEAVALWNAFPSKLAKQFPLPPGFTCSIELEGVDGKSGHPGSGRTAGIPVDDDDWSRPYLAKNADVIATNPSPTCSICKKPIQEYDTDPLKSTLCTTDHCTAVSHLACLAEEFHRQNPNTPSLAPRGGHCPSCHSYTLWGDYIRGQFRRQAALMGVDAFDSEDLFDSDSEDNLAEGDEGTHTKKRGPRGRKRQVAARTPSRKPRSESRSRSPTPATVGLLAKPITSKAKGKQKASVAQPDSSYSSDSDTRLTKKKRASRNKLHRRQDEDGTSGSSGPEQRYPPSVPDDTGKTTKTRRKSTPPLAIINLTDSDPEPLETALPSSDAPQAPSGSRSHSTPPRSTVLVPSSTPAKRKPGRPRKRPLGVQEQDSEAELARVIFDEVIPSDSVIDGDSPSSAEETNGVFQDGNATSGSARHTKRNAIAKAKPSPSPSSPSSRQEEGTGRRRGRAPDRVASPSPKRKRSVPSGKRLYHTPTAAPGTDQYAHAYTQASGGCISHLEHSPRPFTPSPCGSSSSSASSPAPLPRYSRPIKESVFNNETHDVDSAGRDEPAPLERNLSGEYYDLDAIEERDVCTKDDGRMSIDTFVRTFKKQLKQTPVLKKNNTSTPATARTKVVPPTPSLSKRPLEPFPLPLPGTVPDVFGMSGRTATTVTTTTASTFADGSSAHHQVPSKNATTTRSKNNLNTMTRSRNNVAKTTNRTPLPRASPAKTTYSDLDEDDLYSRDTDSEREFAPFSSPSKTSGVPVSSTRPGRPGDDAPDLQRSVKPGVPQDPVLRLAQQMHDLGILGSSSNHTHRALMPGNGHGDEDDDMYERDTSFASSAVNQRPVSGSTHPRRACAIVENGDPDVMELTD